MMRVNNTLMHLLLSSFIVLNQPVSRVNAYTQIHKQIFRRTTAPLSSDRRNIVFMNPSVDVNVYEEKEILATTGENNNSDTKMTAEQKTQLNILSKNAPRLVEFWLALVLETGKSDGQGIQELMKNIGPIPEKDGELAQWINALVSSVASLGVGVDIKNAMNSCKNDFQRVKLATIALQAGIDQMSGKRISSQRL